MVPNASNVLCDQETAQVVSFRPFVPLELAYSSQSHLGSATFRACMNFLHYAAEHRINYRFTFETCRVVNLVCVMIHFGPASGADHFIGLVHGRDLTCLRIITYAKVIEQQG